MSCETPAELQRRKQQIRAEARARLRSQPQPQREQRSVEICRRVAALSEYAAAGTVMSYVDFGCEPQTRPWLPRVWQQGKRLVVP
jgi:5-formyltetrahydrofolate cyclo-ligase